MAITPASPSPEDASNGNGNGKPPAVLEMIEEAEKIRQLLQEALNRVGRLTTALKQQRRQSRAVHAAMASLKQLQWEH